MKPLFADSPLIIGQPAPDPALYVMASISELENTIGSGLGALFCDQTVSVVARVDGGLIVVTATIHGDFERGPKFTFSQMHALPSILGTEHIDFSTDAGYESGSEWTGDYGHHNDLIITARVKIGGDE